MMYDSGFIKLHRQLINWEWYCHTNVKCVFIHCLLMANFKPSRFQGYEIPAGGFVTSYNKLSEQTGLSVRQVRRALEHLNRTNEVTKYSTSKFTIITVNNWSEYQTEGKVTDTQGANNGQTTDNQGANEGQTRGNRRRIYKNIEESKEKKEEASSDEEELDEPCINYKDIKQWEADNGKQWEGWIDWSD